MALIGGVAFVLTLVAAVVGWVAAGDVGANRLAGAMAASGPWAVAGVVAEVGLLLSRRA